jgi:hypothetical protein
LISAAFPIIILLKKQCSETFFPLARGVFQSGDAAFLLHIHINGGKFEWIL